MQQKQDFPYRNAMLDDLIKSRILKGIKKGDVFQLLGEPSRTDTHYLFYRVAQQRLGALPLHTKTLVIKMDSLDVVQTVLIHQ